MAKPAHMCPDGWKETDYSKRSCGRPTFDEDQCYLTVFPSTHDYSKVCGRIAAYKWGRGDAFNNFNQGQFTDLDEAYVDGIVLTYGTPSKHIWTFAVGASESRDTEQAERKRCPCDLEIDDRPNVPGFVADHYFCEAQNEIFPTSGNERFRLYSEDILWDGDNCLSTSNCCEFNRPPYFIRDLGETTSSGIDARICFRNSGSDIAIEIVELYVHK